MTSLPNRRRPSAGLLIAGASLLVALLAWLLPFAPTLPTPLLRPSAASTPQTPLPATHSQTLAAWPPPTDPHPPVLFANGTGAAHLIDPDLLTLLDREHALDGGIDSLALAPNSAWFVLRNPSHVWSNNTGDELSTAVNYYTRKDTPITQVALGPDGAWVVLAGRNAYTYRGVPHELADTLQTRSQAHDEIKQVALYTPDAWLVLANKNDFYGRAPEQVTNCLAACRASDREIRYAALGPASTWFVLCDTTPWGSLPEGILQSLATLPAADNIDQVAFGPDSSWVILAHQD